MMSVDVWCTNCRKVYWLKIYMRQNRLISYRFVQTTRLKGDVGTCRLRLHPTRRRALIAVIRLEGWAYSAVTEEAILGAVTRVRGCRWMTNT